MEFIELRDIKSKMLYEISEYEKDKQELNILHYRICILKEVLQKLDIDNFNNIKKNYLAIAFLLKEIFNKEDFDNYMNSIITIVNKNANYEKEKEIFETEINSNTKRYSNILMRLNMLYKESIDRIEFLKLKVKQNKEKVSCFKPIITAIDSNTSISNYQSFIISEFMKGYDYSNKDRIIIKEKINEHNMGAKEQITYNTYKSRVLKILNKDVQLYDLKGILKNGSKNNINKLENLVSSIIISINVDSDYKTISETLSSDIYDLYSDDEVEYIYKSVSNYYLKHMKEDQEDLLDEELYSTYEMRQVIVNDFFNKLAIYYRINRVYTSNRKEEIKEETQDTKVFKNNLVFVRRNENHSYFEKDISKMSDEKLKRVKYLIEGFRNDTLGKADIKSFNSNHPKRKKFIELKSDQVRIVCINISNNNYFVIGAGIKKTDNDSNLYDKFAERLSSISDDINEIKEEETYAKVMTYIDDNARKTNR